MPTPTLYDLYRAIRTNIEDDEGSWRGSEVVDLLNEWFTQQGWAVTGPITERGN